MPVRPRVRYCIRTPEVAGEMYGRSLDVVPWTKRNAFPEEYGKLFRKALAAAHEPGAALANWLHRYTEFLATKRGLATALHSGDPAFDALPGYFFQRLEPALGSLLDAAAAAGEIRADISAGDLLRAVALLCTPVSDEGIAYSRRMVTLLIDGLRYPAELRRSSS